MAGVARVAREADAQRGAQGGPGTQGVHGSDLHGVKLPHCFGMSLLHMVWRLAGSTVTLFWTRCTTPAPVILRPESRSGPPNRG